MGYYRKFGDVKMYCTARDFIIEVPNSSYFVSNTDDEVVIKPYPFSNNNFSFKLKSYIDFEDIYFQINYITKNSQHPNKVILSLDRSRTSNFFICPLILTPEQLNIEKFCFINSYLLPKATGHSLVLVYNNKIIEDFTLFISKIANDKLINTTYKNDYVFLEYSISESILKDVMLIIDSKYSSISESSKDIINNYFHFLHKLTSNKLVDLTKMKIYKVLYKSEELRREMEKSLNEKIPSHLDLYEFFDLEKETISYKMFDYDVKPEFSQRRRDGILYTEDKNIT